MKRLSVMILFILALGVALPFTTVADKWQGLVVRVVDGDTLVTQRGQQPVDIRLNGIGSPELDQPYGGESRILTVSLCLNQRVRVIPYGVGRYRRITTDVILPNDRNLNQELVRAGAAWWYKRYAKKDKPLARLECEA